MTATSPARRRTDARYRGVVYGLDVLDHHTGQIVPNDYVGKTRQKGRARENQHRDDQPFSDRIVGSPRVLWEGDCTEVELNEMERRFIQDVPTEQRPRLNWKMNEDNPYQIPKWVQVEQRHERDDREDRPRWVPSDQRARSSLLDWDTPAPVAVRQLPRRRWSSRRKHLTGLVVAWAVLTFAGWISLAVYDVLNRYAMIAVVLAGLWLSVWVWAGVPVTSRGLDKAERRARKRLGLKRGLR